MTSGHVYKVEAIVLARKSTGEADRILTLFTKEYGKIRVLAKGIRRVKSRRGPHAEIFSRVIIMLHASKTNLDLVGEITPLETYQTLRESLKRVSSAYYLCELIDRLLPESQEHRDVYELLTSELRLLNDTDVSYVEQNHEEFARQLLQKLGFLSKDKNLADGALERYIENIIQRRLRTPKIMRQLS